MPVPWFSMARGRSVLPCVLACMLLSCAPSSAAPRPLVAVLDSGVDMSAPGLARHAWRNPGEKPGNGRDDDHNGLVDDVHAADFVEQDGFADDWTGHGTMIAGIIARRRARLRLLPIRVVGRNGHGSERQLARGIEYAVAAHARIINLSLSGYRPTARLRAAVEHASRSGALLVTAAGNRPIDLDRHPAYPASFDVAGQIVVASSYRGTLAWFSGYGASVDVAAPGVAVAAPTVHGRPARLTGTSASAAEVSGVAALLLRRHPHATPQAVGRAVVRGTRGRRALAGRIASGLLSVRGAARSLLAVLAAKARRGEPRSR